MSYDSSISRSIRRVALAAALAGFFAIPLLLPTAAEAQISGNPDINTSKKANYQNECAIIKNPTNKMELFAACNNSTGGIFATRSNNLGVTWTYPDPVDKTIADGDAGQGPVACCDPTLAWDSFGNLYVGYLTSTSVVILLSTDSGATFSTLATFAGSVDQPTVVAADTSAPGAPVAVWFVWNQSGSMRASGAAVTGLGAVGAFGAVQTIPGTTGCSFGDVAISPAGAVVQTCQAPVSNQGPSTIRVNIDADGLGAGNFGAAISATTTNVGGFDFIPAQNVRSVDSEAGLAYDSYAMSPHFGRLYLVYTEETAPENNDLDILVRFSDDDGATWSSPPIRVNDDVGTRSQFMPKIASNRLSGNIAVCWHDARNSGTNTAMQEFCSIATPSGPSPTFMANGQIGDALTTGNGSNPPVAGQANIEFGDYSGLTYHQGVAHPIWADISNSTGDNPDGTVRFDAYTDRVSGGAAAMEGDPHIATVNGTHYDFQGGGEYTVLRDSDGSEIQARHSPVATTFVVGPNGHTGLTSCASLTTAVAAQVGNRRVTYQPNLSGVPDPSGLQLRIDSALTTLTGAGINLGNGGRISQTGAPGGILIEFPNGTRLTVTPGWWASQSKWYLNLNVSRSSALEGIMGAVADGWLPRLPDGTSLGTRPAALAARYTDLYTLFGDAWRVNAGTSLFDYAPGTSTSTFTYAGWPSQTLPCVVPKQKPVEPLDRDTAVRVCRDIRDRHRNNDCVFDVITTGEVGFAQTYLMTEALLAGATHTAVTGDKVVSRVDEAVTFTAVVEPETQGGERAPAGTVQFFVDGREEGERVEIDAKGQATWRTSFRTDGTYQVTAVYTPNEGSGYLPSTSGEETHTVGEGEPVKR